MADVIRGDRSWLASALRLHPRWLTTGAVGVPLLKRFARWVVLLTPSERTPTLRDWERRTVLQQRRPRSSRRIGGCCPSRCGPPEALRAVIGLGGPEAECVLHE